MCATPRPKRKKVLGAIAGDIAVHAALADAMSGIPSVVGALLAAQAKKDWAKIAGAPKPVANAVTALPAAVGKKAGTVDGAPTPVAKASKECSPVTADIAVPAKVVAVPAPVTKAPGPFHPTGVMVELLGRRWVTGAALVRSTPTTAARCWPRTWWCAFGRCRFRLRGGRRRRLLHIG
jgi:hypothetical protein